MEYRNEIRALVAKAWERAQAGISETHSVEDAQTIALKYNVSLLQVGLDIAQETVAFANTLRRVEF